MRNWDMWAHVSTRCAVRAASAFLLQPNRFSDKRFALPTAHGRSADAEVRRHDMVREPIARGGPTFGALRSTLALRGWRRCRSRHRVHSTPSSGNTMDTSTFARAALRTVTFAAVLAPAVASAQLNGATLGAQVQTALPGTFFQDLGTRVVGPGVEFSSSRNEQIDVFDSGFTYSALGGGFFTPLPFNGIRLYDPGSLAPDFLGVSIVGSAGGFAGFDMSRVTFDANNIYVNVQGLNIPRSVTFAVRAAAVPEPGTWALCSPLRGWRRAVGAALP
jgi:hypothetical protein